MVTGGSRGIGRAIVLRLAEDGARVVFSYCQNQTGQTHDTSFDHPTIGEIAELVGGTL